LTGPPSRSTCSPAQPDWTASTGNMYHVGNGGLIELTGEFTTGGSWKAMRDGGSGGFGEEDLPLAFTIEGQPKSLEY